MNNDTYCIILTTTDEESNADAIAARLVSSKLAACVQIGKVKSYYNWKAELHKDEEYRLSIKAPIGNYAAIEEAILEVHNYSLPQIIKLQIAGGFEGYLSWLEDSCYKQSK